MMLRTRTIRFLLALVLPAVGMPLLRAQTAQTLDQRLAAIVERNEYAVESFGPTAWLDGGRRYTTLSRGTPRELVAHETETGRTEVLLGAKDLVPPGASTPLEIGGYAWSPDGTKLLVFTNTRRVWRQNTRGDYWVVEMASKALKKLGGDAPEASLMFAKFSPDSQRVAYVRAQNVYVEDVASGRIAQLTTDGGGDIVNGTSDWVNEEEFGLRDCFRWSPDGSRIAYWQFDTSGVGRFTLINNTDSLYPTITQFPYPKPGTTNSAVRVGIVPAAGGSTTWARTPGDPRSHYIARMEWVDDRTIGLQHMNRPQNTNDYLLADAASGDVRRAFRDQSRTWVDDADPVVWVSEGREFTWVSEKDGWRHVYAIARDGGRERLLTRFDGDIQAVDAVDARGGLLYFTASPDDATQRSLYMSRLDGDGTVTRVTPADQPGTHGYDISPDGRWAIHTHSRFEMPPRIAIVSLPEHRAVRTLVDNAALAAKAAPLLAQAVEFLKVDVGGGVVLDGYMLRPRTFDARGKYPVLVHVYGEPAGTTVNDRWGGNGMLFHRALADQGYLVVSFDNRGTPALKGAAWRKVVYGTVGELSAKEQAAAIRRLAAERPYVDLDRVAIYGTSGGGSNTLNAMFRYPEVYRVGISIAPVPDQRLYDTIYQERYMGLPQENEAGYRVGSPINFAEGLRGRLLVVHGTGDDNVHYQGTERLINRLVELGKTFDVMVYPNRTHSLSEGTGTVLHLRRLTARYLMEHLPPGQLPASSSQPPAPSFQPPAFSSGVSAYRSNEGRRQTSDVLRNPDHPEMTRRAPDVFRVALETSRGPITIEVHRDWSPHGADRFYNLVRHGYYDEARFFRVREGQWVQFGIAADPEVARIWRTRTIPDDPRKVSNVRGTVAYAFRDPDGRTTQVFINLRDNRTTHDAEPFVPFGRVVEGMEAADALYAGYGEKAGGGIRAGRQDPLFAEGNAYLAREFPLLDYIRRASVASPRFPASSSQ